VKKAIIIFVAASLALIGGVGARILIAQSKTETKQGALPDFSLPDLNGQMHSINEWQDKVRVINFWATWCHPCLKEMPEFNQLQNDYSSKGMQLIGVALDDPEPVQAFVDKHKIAYPILVSPDEGIRIAHDLGNVVNTVPFTVIVDKTGRMVKSHMGTLTGEELLKIAGPLLKN